MKKRVLCLLTAAAFIMPQLSGKATFLDNDSAGQALTVDLREGEEVVLTEAMCAEAETEIDAVGELFGTPSLNSFELAFSRVESGFKGGNAFENAGIEPENARLYSSYDAEVVSFNYEGLPAFTKDQGRFDDYVGVPMLKIDRTTPSDQANIYNNAYRTLSLPLVLKAGKTYNVSVECILSASEYKMRASNAKNYYLGASSEIPITTSWTYDVKNTSFTPTVNDTELNILDWNAAGSSGVLYIAAINIIEADTNTVIYSNDFTKEAFYNEEYLNTDEPEVEEPAGEQFFDTFDNGLGTWKKNSDDSVSVYEIVDDGGNNVLRMVPKKLQQNGAYAGYLSNRIPVDANSEYTLTWRAKAVGNNGTVVMCGITVTQNNATGDWQYYSNKMKSDANGYLTLTLFAANFDEIFFDDFYLFKNTAAKEGKVQNGAFDNNLANWISTGEVRVFNENENNFLVPGQNSEVQQSITLAPNSEYILRAKYKITNNTSGQNFGVYLKNGNAAVFGSKNIASEVTDAWNGYALEFNSGSYTELTLCIFAPTGVTVYVDDVSLKNKNEAPKCILPSCYPNDGEENLSVNDIIILKFDDLMDKESLTNIEFICENDNYKVDFDVEEADGYKYYLKPKSHFSYNSDYRITMDERVVSAFGISLDEPISLKFRTEARDFEVSEFKITDETGNKISELVGGSVVRAECNVANATAKERNISVILALYKDSSMIDAVITNASISPNRSSSVAKAELVLPQNTNGCKVKAFVLSDEGELVALYSNAGLEKTIPVSYTVKESGTGILSTEGNRVTDELSIEGRSEDRGDYIVLAVLRPGKSLADIPSGECSSVSLSDILEYIDQGKTDGEGGFAFTLGFAHSSGVYTLYAGSRSSEKAYSKEYEFFSSTDTQAFLNVLLGQESSSAMLALLEADESKMKMLDIDKTVFDKLNKARVMDIVYSGKKDIKDPNQFKERFEYAIAMRSLSEAANVTVFTETLEKYDKYIKIREAKSYPTYESSEYKQLMLERLLGGDYDNREEFLQAFNDKVICSAVEKVSNKIEAVPILKSNNEILKINFDNYDKLKNKEPVDSAVAGKTFTDITGLIKTFNAAVEKQRLAESESGRVSSGGTGSGAVSGWSGNNALTQNTNITNDVKYDSETMQNQPFTDILSVHWAVDSIYYLYEKNYISGKGDKLFAPNDSIKREEFIKILVNVFDLYDENAVCNFTDVDESSWEYPYIASAVAAGVTSGIGDNMFGTGMDITRQDMAVLI
ncbi:MAG: S-layer homology domain-containing protein, partial [Clostridia bacterium]|nr:S-layer homology domain-containing protein [Clostridia bacterium]